MIFYTKLDITNRKIRYRMPEGIFLYLLVRKTNLKGCGRVYQKRRGGGKVYWDMEGVWKRRNSAAQVCAVQKMHASVLGGISETPFIGPACCGLFLKVSFMIYTKAIHIWEGWRNL